VRSPVSYVLLVFAALTLFTFQSDGQQAPPLAGRNVNMVSYGTYPGGDPYLQRQNEVTIAVSTRNVQHLMAGANDYRSVDIPNIPDPR
jgi:hypothetical protein